MGKSKKHKKKDKKKHYSSSSDSSSQDEWVEKSTSNKSNSSSPDNKSTTKEPKIDTKREEWMSLPTSFLSSSNLDRRKEREEKIQIDRERQLYNPRECPRELNPHWKHGGDGLPKFKKPSEDESSYKDKYKSSGSYVNRQSGWRKKKDEPIVEKSSKNDEICESGEVLSEKELNALAAKVVKAEIMGNKALASELKIKLENARKNKQNKVEDVILVHTDSQGRTQALKQKSEYGESSGSRNKKQKTETHKNKERVRYFPDDDKYSLKEMFENEKYNTVEDQNKEFITSVSKIKKNDDLDDIFTDNITKKESDYKTDKKNADRAIEQHRKVTKSLENCNKCIQSDLTPKHLMISMNETLYLTLPSFEPLTEGHCQIIPIRHTPCSTQLDENEWSDILDTRKSLVNMFRQKQMDVIFFEVAKDFHRYPHMTIECIPLPLEQADLAPIYFKKAIDESETEWAMNKKLVSLSNKDVRKAIPKGLPYFFVSFGMQEGYAHVIEDEKMFPSNFAQEIIGGMLDLEHNKWRKPKKEKFDEQSKRVKEFARDWAKFDSANVQ